jgi:hypothetical protein
VNMQGGQVGEPTRREDYVEIGVWGSDLIVVKPGSAQHRTPRQRRVRRGEEED